VADIEIAVINASNTVSARSFRAGLSWPLPSEELCLAV